MKGGIVGTYVRETGRDILDTERPIMLVPRTALAQLLQQRERWLEFPIGLNVSGFAWFTHHRAYFSAWQSPRI